MVSFSIPGTDTFITTDREEATIASIPTSDNISGEIADQTGVTEFRQSETGQELQEEFEDADSRFERFDVAVASGTDFLLDNPRASVQDTVRGGIARVTGLSSEEQAERAQEIDAGVTESIDEQIEGTAFDNPATGFIRQAGDVLIGEGVRTFVGAGTGIDPRVGDTEARTGAFELADIGLTLGTGGVARGGISALRAARAGEGVTTTFRAGDTGTSVVRSGDEAATTTARSGGDTTTSVVPRSSSEGARSSEGIMDMIRRQDGTFTARSADEAATGGARSADEVARSVDESTEVLPTTVRAADETGSAGARTADEIRESIGRIVDDATGGAARAADDLGGTAARSADNLGGATARVSDDATRAAARSSDDLATRIRNSLSRLGSRLGSASRTAARSRPARLGAAAGTVTAGVIGGGAIVTELRDRYEMADGTVLVREDTFQATDRFGGGVLYRVQDAGSTVGYGVVVGRDGRNLLILDNDGGVDRAHITVEQLRELEGGN